MESEKYIVKRYVFIGIQIFLLPLYQSFRKDQALELIQVAYEIDTPKSYNRETSALIQAAGPLHCDNLTLIAFSPTRDVEIDGKTIHIVSAIEWLLA